MEALNKTASLPINLQPFNHDEICMQHNLLFAESLEDLKSLKTQLYSAAEYFELSCTNDDKKKIVVHTLKDYAVKALVSTVDHLGFIACKVNDLLHVKVEEVSKTEFRVSCMEQRLRTCHEYINMVGLAQQSSVTNNPRHRKGYTLTAEESLINKKSEKSEGCGLDVDWPPFRRATSSTITEVPLPSIREGHCPSPSPQLSQPPGTFSLFCAASKKDLENRAVSPHRIRLLRSGSLPTRLTTPKTSRPKTPNSTTEGGRRYPPVLWKSASVRVQGNRGSNLKEVERHPSKRKGLLKALLSRRKAKKDDVLYTYIDGY